MTGRPAELMRKMLGIGGHVVQPGDQAEGRQSAGDAGRCLFSIVRPRDNACGGLTGRAQLLPHIPPADLVVPSLSTPIQY